MRTLRDIVLDRPKLSSAVTVVIVALCFAAALIFHSRPFLAGVAFGVMWLVFRFLVQLTEEEPSKTNASEGELF